MAYPELKTESYTLLGGMNSKASPYNNGPMEFRDLTNYQFSQPGAIDGRPGTTLYLAGSTTVPITGLDEYTKLNGSSYLIKTELSEVFSISSTGQTLLYSYGATNGWFDFITMVDTLFMTTPPLSGGFNFIETGIRKFNGSSVMLFGLPNGVAIGSSGFFTASPGLGGSLTSAGATTTFTIGYGYLNLNGYYGPISVSPSTYQPYTVTINGTTQNSIVFSGMEPPPLSGTGATSIVIYRSLEDKTVPFAATFAPLSGATFVLSEPGLGVEPANFDFFSSQDFPDGIANPEPFSTYFAPAFLEQYNLQLFLGGLKVNPSLTGLPEDTYASSFFFSELGVPEKISAENLREVRTNDGDVLSGLKAYNQGLVITKYKSVHQLSGTDPTNFLIQQVSDQYGCLSNRAMVVFNNVLWMLDSKGIVEYNGANIQIVSTKMDPVFARMNIKAAKQQALGIFFKESNQVWFSFPVDGSSKNNMIVVYDIISNAWTKFEGLDLASLTVVDGSLDRPHVFYGGYSGSVCFFDQTLTNDYGKNGITYSFQTPYYAPTGQSIERQFRRFYLNVDPVTGSSTPIELRFLPDFGSTVGHTTYIYQAPFQTRVDFGIPAKSMSAVGVFASPTFTIKVNGYTFESRFQRNV